MLTHSDYELIIVGGSYAGLAAALSLGRAFTKRNIPIVEEEFIAIEHEA